MHTQKINHAFCSTRGSKWATFEMRNGCALLKTSGLLRFMGMSPPSAFFVIRLHPGRMTKKACVLGSFTQRCGCYAALHWAIIFRPYGASKWMKGSFLQSETVSQFSLFCREHRLLDTNDFPLLQDGVSLVRLPGT